MIDINDWWEDTLNQDEREGIKDAELGIYEPPYPNSDDPADQEENWAYDKGFKKRRKELGDKFKWA